MRPSIQLYIELSIYLFDGSFNGIAATVGQWRESVKLLNYLPKAFDRQCGYDLYLADLEPTILNLASDLFQRPSSFVAASAPMAATI